ncbi:MAG TPA: hypothetical protein VFD41_08860 [Actinomycetales bacterium]|nr:hypothetical protein [Actinomycetales bacterium]
MAEIDPTTLTPSELAPMLRNWAEGVPTLEAAANLIINHDVWLRRPDFLRACVVAVDHGMSYGTRVPMAAISWQRSATFLDGAAASRSELAVLRLACSIGGVNTGALADLTAGLDPVNTAGLLDAVAHSKQWHKQGIQHTVDGRQDRHRGPRLGA